MDKLKKLVAEQLAGESYNITDWRDFAYGETTRVRELEIDLGEIKITYQQSNLHDYFYGGAIVNDFYSPNWLFNISISTHENYNYKRDVAFVRSILPELEAMLDKVQAYRELAR